MADGHVNKCKTCNKKDTKADYDRKIVDPEWKLKERDRSREKMRKCREDGRYKTTSPEDSYLKSKKFRENYPEKYAAHIASQRIPLEPCVVCGSTEKIERHHEDYSKPKEVTFLCKKHHSERHVEIRKQQLLNGK